MVLVRGAAQDAVEDGNGLGAGDVLIRPEGAVLKAQDDPGGGSLVDEIGRPVPGGVGEQVRSVVLHVEEADGHGGELRPGDVGPGAEAAVGIALHDAAHGHGGDGGVAPHVGGHVGVGIALAPELLPGLVGEHPEEDGGHLGAGDGRLGMDQAVLAADDVGVVVDGVQAGGGLIRDVRRGRVVGDDLRGEDPVHGGRQALQLVAGGLGDGQRDSDILLAALGVSAEIHALGQGAAVDVGIDGLILQVQDALDLVLEPLRHGDGLAAELGDHSGEGGGMLDAVIPDPAAVALDLHAQERGVVGVALAGAQHDLDGVQAGVFHLDPDVLDQVVAGHGVLEVPEEVRAVGAAVLKAELLGLGVEDHGGEVGAVGGVGGEAQAAHGQDGGQEEGDDAFRSLHPVHPLSSAGQG